MDQFIKDMVLKINFKNKQDGLIELQQLLKIKSKLNEKEMLKYLYRRLYELDSIYYWIDYTYENFENEYIAYKIME